MSNTTRLHILLLFILVSLVAAFFLFFNPPEANAAPGVESTQASYPGNLAVSAKWADQFSAGTGSATALTVPAGAFKYLLNATGYVWVCDNPVDRCATTKPAGSTSNGSGWVLGPMSRQKATPGGTIYVQGHTAAVSGSVEWSN